MPKISVIIPVFNAEIYLQRCLESVINQTLQDIEIICIDDCSKDSSVEILHSYSKKEKRLKVIHHLENKGESVARNTGIKVAQGEYLAFVDNDDALDSDFLEKLYTQSDSDNPDIIKGEVKEVSYSGKILEDKLNPIIKSGGKLFFSYNWWTAIYKRDLIIKNNIFFPEGFPLGGDILFLNKAVIAANRVVTVDGTFYNYFRREESGDSKILSIEKLNSALSVYEMCIDNLNQNNLNSQNAYSTVVYWFIRSAINMAFRNNSQEYKRICNNYIQKLYKKSEAKPEIDSNIKKDFSIEMLDCIQREDSEHLQKLLSDYSAVSKVLFAKLRNQIKKVEVNNV